MEIELDTCAFCPIYKDGNRSESMCGHLECWKESNDEIELKRKTSGEKL